MNIDPYILSVEKRQHWVCRFQRSAMCLNSHGESPLIFFNDKYLENGTVFTTANWQLQVVYDLSSAPIKCVSNFNSTMARYKSFTYLLTYLLWGY